MITMLTEYPAMACMMRSIAVMTARACSVDLTASRMITIPCTGVPQDHGGPTQESSSPVGEHTSFLDHVLIVDDFYRMHLQ